MILLLIPTITTSERMTNTIQRIGGIGKMDNIGKFELIDHGIEHSQYFQGCGITYADWDHTGWENVVTGIGDNPAEAINDCLEQMAMGGDDVKGMEARIMGQEGWEQFPDTPFVCGECEGAELEECQGCELHYHVSIRWNRGS